MTTVRIRLILLLATLLLAGCLAESGSQNPPREPSEEEKATNSPEPNLEETTAAEPVDASALAIFRQRILPILQAPNPSSCSECHLSGVDLKDYIRDDHQQTFAALREAGLINLRRPDQSRILQFIQRKPDQPSLITDKIRKQEYEAFRAWIHAAVKDPQLVAAETGEPVAIGPQLPEEVIRHARQDRVLKSFIEHVWLEVGRCAACHSPDRNQKQVDEHGEQVSWISLNDPQATLQHLIEADLVDLEQPEQSLLLLKPTNQVEHGGGQKMMIGDRTYKQFRRFLEDYAAVSSGRYRSEQDLPAPPEEIGVASDIWFKLTNVPERFDTMLLRVDLHRWDAATQDWSEDRWATGDRAVFGKGKLWQQHLSIVASRDAERAEQIRQRPQLPPGRYLVKIYIDQAKKLEQSPDAELTEADLVGEVEVDSRWPSGYGEMTVAEFPPTNVLSSAETSGREP